MYLTDYENFRLCGGIITAIKKGNKITEDVTGLVANKYNLKYILGYGLKESNLFKVRTIVSELNRQDCVDRNFYFLIYKGTREKHFKDSRYRKLPCKSIDDLYLFFNLDDIFDYDSFLDALNAKNKPIYVYINPQYEYNYKMNVLYWSCEPDKSAKQYYLFLHGIAKV